MKAEVLRFTLHSATIKTKIYENPENVFNIFTLHSATIKTPSPKFLLPLH